MFRTILGALAFAVAGSAALAGPLDNFSDFELRVSCGVAMKEQAERSGFRGEDEIIDELHELGVKMIHSAEGVLRKPRQTGEISGAVKNLNKSDLHNFGKKCIVEMEQRGFLASLVN